jgi:hypothetical protein
MNPATRALSNASVSGGNFNNNERVVSVNRKPPVSPFLARTAMGPGADGPIGESRKDKQLMAARAGVEPGDAETGFPVQIQLYHTCKEIIVCLTFMSKKLNGPDAR